MQQGDKLIFKAPKSFDFPYVDFSPEWKVWVRFLDGTAITLDEPDEMNIDFGTIEGWRVISDVQRPGYVSNWLPAIWLRKPEETVSAFCDACGGFRKHRLMCPANRP